MLKKTILFMYFSIFPMQQVEMDLTPERAQHLLETELYQDQKCNVEKVRWYLNLGANVHFKTNKMASSSLEYALLNCPSDTFLALIEKCDLRYWSFLFPNSDLVELARKSKIDSETKIKIIEKLNEA